MGWRKNTGIDVVGINFFSCRTPSKTQNKWNLGRPRSRLGSVEPGQIQAGSGTWAGPGLSRGGITLSVRHSLPISYKYNISTIKDQALHYITADKETNPFNWTILCIPLL